MGWLESQTFLGEICKIIIFATSGTGCCASIQKQNLPSTISGHGTHELHHVGTASFKIQELCSREPEYGRKMGMLGSKGSLHV